jgi:glycosyltransferase involved in cell wall biosynthesis
MNARSLQGGILMTMHRLSQGGADRVAVLLANGFIDAGIPTGILLLRSQGEAERALLDLLHPDVWVGSAGQPIGSRHLELVRGLPSIQRHIALLQPSVVLASSNNMGLITGLSARLQGGRGPRYAMKVTNPVVRPRDRGPLLKLYRRRLYGFIFEKYDRILTLSDAEQEGLSAMYPRLAARFQTTINAYITPAMLADYPRTYPSGTANILTLARMMPQKRLDLLLTAFAQVQREDARLTILGDGPERPSLERLAQALGIAERVDMPGFFEDVVPALRRADLFVLSSDYEGWPAALLEALACNVPVVTTDCFAGARRLLARAERSAVVPRGDTSAFARAIEASLAVEQEPNGLRDIARGYTIEASIAAHVAALRPLLGERQPGTASIGSLRDRPASARARLPVRPLRGRASWRLHGDIAPHAGNWIAISTRCRHPDGNYL